MLVLVRVYGQGDFSATIFQLVGALNLALRPCCAPNQHHHFLVSPVKYPPYIYDFHTPCVAFPPQSGSSILLGVVYHWAGGKVEF